MLSTMFTQSLQQHLFRNLKQIRRLSTSSSLASQDKSGENEEKPVVEKKQQNENQVTSKLNNLLQSMIQQENETAKPTIQIQLAQAKIKRKKEKPEPEKPLAEKLSIAAKDVAESIGGNVEKTESELLNILLRRTEPSVKQLKDVLEGIKVEKNDVQSSRAQQVRDSLAQSRELSPRERREPLAGGDKINVQIRRSQKKNVTHANILGAEKTSYFSDLKPQPSPCEMATWNACVARDLRLAVTHPPASPYEQMIQWTDRGILWRFPIDNEQDLDEEKKVSFEEHIFLENHLEDWCPESGPIRHFMELVCVGLSKNYWLTAQEKRNHILWFRDYFADKQALLKEIGAGSIGLEEKTQQQISS